MFEIQNNQVLAFYSGSPNVHNSGTIRKSSGGGDSTIAVPLINSGTLELSPGRVGYLGGSQFNSGTFFTGAGTNLFYKGNATFNGAFNSDNLEIGGAAILGTNTLADTVRWTSGAIGEDARVTIPTNGILNLPGTIDRTVQGTLINAGIVNWPGASVIYFVHLGTVSNLADGTFEMQNNGALAHYSGVSAFRNAGVLRKSAGAGATSINLSAFHNTGTVDAQTGLIRFQGSYSQTGGRLQFGLSSVTNFGQIQFVQTAPLTGTLAANLLGGFRPKAGDAFAVISSYPSHSGSFTAFDLPNEAAWQTNSSIYGANAVTLSVLNARPSINPISDQTGDEETAITFTAIPNDPDLAQTFSFSLVGAPAGATIQADTGAFSWTPTEAEGPATNTFALRVMDNGSPALSHTQNVTILVHEVNRAPLLADLPPQLVAELTSLTVTNLASDPDLPLNTIRYALVAPPAGVSIDTNTGVVAWTPTEVQGPGPNTITVIATDDGSPARSATNRFTVSVTEVNSSPTLTAPGDGLAVPGATFVLTNTATDPDRPMNALSYSLLTFPVGATINADTGVVSWPAAGTDAESTNLFTVVVEDNGVPSLSATQSFRTIVLPLPLLTIKQTNGLVTLSWPGVYAGFLPQKNTNLMPVRMWFDLTNPVISLGTNSVMTDTPSTNETYYRLQHP